KGHFFPAGADSFNWLWLSLSGFIGFVIGDLFLFKSYTIIGSRFSMLIMALVPPLAALFGFLILKERIGYLNYLGMALTIGGISMAILSRENENSRLTLKLPVKGVLFAFGGAAGQALGLVLSKLGMISGDPFASTQIRIIAGIAGFSILVTYLKRWKRVYHALFHLKAMQGIATGSFFGPFLGVSFSLLAVTHTQTGIASTIMAIVPVLIIAPAVILFKQKITIYEVIGAVISVSGVALFFIL
ncbi:MAG: DMT family transporter, partial [Bacteroidales bacterium]